MKILSKFRIVSVLTVLICAVLAFAAVGTSHAESTLETVQKRGKLLAGVRFDVPPIGYVDAQGNNIGFGPDIAREFAKHLGVEVEFVQVTSQNRIPLLLNGLIDAEIGGTTPTKARDEVIDFAYTYALDQLLIIVRDGDSTDPEDYFNSDKVVGALQGSYVVSLWKHFSPDANIKEYQAFTDVVLALAQGKVDVVTASSFTGPEVIEVLGKRTENLVVGGIYFDDPWAIGLRENDSDWRDWVNWALQRMWIDGTFQEIYKKHYKTEPAFQLGDAGRLQPGVEKVGEKGDAW